MAASGCPPTCTGSSAASRCQTSGGTWRSSSPGAAGARGRPSRSGPSGSGIGTRSSGRRSPGCSAGTRRWARQRRAARVLAQ
eukprot:3577105-Alexandrium_andersonii.AAC.1